MKKRMEKITNIALIIISLLTLMLFPSVCTAVEGQPILTLHILIDAASSLQFEMASALREEFAKVGIRLEIVSMESGALTDLIYRETASSYEDGGWDLVFSTWWWWPTDYMWFIGCWTAGGWPPSGWNFMRWADSLADSYLINSLSTYNETERIEWLRLWQNRFQENPPVGLLYWPVIPQLSDSKLQKIDPCIWTSNAWQWYVEGKTSEDYVVIKYSVGEDPGMLNPWFMDGGYAHLEPMFSPLFRIKQISLDPPVYEHVPELVESYEFSADGLSVTFHLLRNVTWHDGVPFTARDVVFTYEAILDPDTGATNFGDFSEYVDSVHMMDEYTVVLKLKKVAPHLISMLSSGGLSILPFHVLGNVPHSELRTHETNTVAPAPGTGPYKFVRWVKGQYMELEAFDNYRRGRPFVDKIILVNIADPITALQALKNHEVDALHPSQCQELINEIPTLAGREDIAVRGGIVPAVTFLAFNNNHTVLANPYVRKALCYAIPYEHIINDLLKGYARQANSPVPPYWFGYNQNAPLYVYNIELARNYLEEAGYHYPMPSTPPSAYITEFIAVALCTFIIGFLLGYFIIKRGQK
ncbi:MAG: ABC transporter substrate-binding protein [Candidatus Bathyarchaeia archaeon]